MATLPDLDTANIGFVAYWNAIDDGGASSIEPTEALSASKVQSAVTYDNGVEATFRILSGDNEVEGGRDITLRVKNDGWFVAYFDRTNTSLPASSPTVQVSGVNSYVDVVHNWQEGDAPGQLQQNSLSKAIQDCYNALSNSGNITFNHSSVGLYNYEYSTSSFITMLSQDPGSYQTGFIVTSGTSLDFIHASVRITDDNRTTTINGSTLCSSGNNRDTMWTGPISTYLNSQGTENTIQHDQSGTTIISLFS